MLATELSRREVEDRAAGFSRRLAGQLTDVVIIVAVSGCIAVVVETTTTYNAIVWPLTALYYAWCEGRGSGQTIGKRAMRLRVVDDVNGVPIGVPRALLRFVVSLISFCVCLLGYVAMIGDPARQTWHDKAARAVVIDDR